MNTELRKLIESKCKDFGLTDKAIDELAELAAKGLDDEAKDEDIQSAADSVVPFAKAMQAEITRKAQSIKKSDNKQSKVSQSKINEGNGEGDNTDEKGSEAEPNGDVPAWFSAWKQDIDKKVDALQQENENLKKEKAQSERAAQIASKAKMLGIPDYLMKHVSLAEDADIDKELEEYKQELVNHSLMPKQALERGKAEQAMKDDAKAWAESLPDSE